MSTTNSGDQVAGDGADRVAGDGRATTVAVATVIDVVASRDHRDQAALLRGVAERANRVLVVEGSATSAGPAMGDELQALHETPGAAVRDLARLRLSLLTDPPGDCPVDVRAGIGVGEVIGSGDATSPSQSGSAWWAARAALHEAGRRRNAWPPTRWWAGGDVAYLPAALLALDTLAAGFDDDDRRAALSLLDGRTAAAIAGALGVVPSTLSSRLHGHGVYGFVRTIEAIAEQGGAT